MNDLDVFTVDAVVSLRLDVWSRDLSGVRLSDRAAQVLRLHMAAIRSSLHCQPVAHLAPMGHAGGGTYFQNVDSCPVRIRKIFRIVNAVDRIKRSKLC